jgi:hypothetical protein
MRSDERTGVCLSLAITSAGSVFSMLSIADNTSRVKIVRSSCKGEAPPSRVAVECKEDMSLSFCGHSALDMWRYQSPCFKDVGCSTLSGTAHSSMRSIPLHLSTFERVGLMLNAFMRPHAALRNRVRLRADVRAKVFGREAGNHDNSGRRGCTK